MHGRGYIARLQSILIRPFSDVAFWKQSMRSTSICHLARTYLGLYTLHGGSLKESRSMSQENTGAPSFCRLECELQHSRPLSWSNRSRSAVDTCEEKDSARYVLHLSMAAWLMSVLKGTLTTPSKPRLACRE